MLFAYSYPLLSVFWSLLMFAGFLLWIFIVIWCFIDNFRRRDHHGVAKALWFVFIVFVPLIGVIAYLIARPAVVESRVTCGTGRGSRCGPFASRECESFSVPIDMLIWSGQPGGLFGVRLRVIE